MIGRTAHQKRQAAEARKAHKASLRLTKAQATAKTEAAIEATIARNNASNRTARPLTMDPDRDYIVRKARALYDDKTAWTAVDRILSYTPVRPVTEWRPVGRSVETLLRSLINHVIPTFPMPTILHTVFFGPDAGTRTLLRNLAVSLARGGSLVEAVKNGTFTPPLTRKMCHEVLSVSGGTFPEAVRWVQIKNAGGNRLLHREWMKTRAGQTPQGFLPTREQEVFWGTVLEWFSKLRMFNYTHVGPICDWIAMRLAQDPAFSMKGRSAVAVLREVEVWHRDLTQVKISRQEQKIFHPSGFERGRYDLSKYDDTGNVTKKSIWRCEEVLTTKDLLEEGREMRHCVFSYQYQIVSGHCSIWSLTHENDKGQTGNWRMLTVQVRNETREIVQARGIYNRAPDAIEMQMLLRWAHDNNITVRHT